MLTGGLTDVGTLDTHAVTIDWGDGTLETVAVDPATRRFEVAHRYLDDSTSLQSGVYTITAFAADDDAGVSAAVATRVRVDNVAPQVVFGVSRSGLGGSVVTVTGVVTDVGTLDTHTVRIDWGDGQSTVVPVDPITRTFSGSYHYREAQFSARPELTFTIVVTATDKDGGVGTASRTRALRKTSPPLIRDRRSSKRRPPRRRTRHSSCSTGSRRRVARSLATETTRVSGRSRPRAPAHGSRRPKP